MSDEIHPDAVKLRELLAGKEELPEDDMTVTPLPDGGVKIIIPMIPLISDDQAKVIMSPIKEGPQKETHAWLTRCARMVISAVDKFDGEMTWRARPEGYEDHPAAMLAALEAPDTVWIVDVYEFPHRKLCDCGVVLEESWAGFNLDLEIVIAGMTNDRIWFNGEYKGPHQDDGPHMRIEGEFEDRKVCLRIFGEPPESVRTPYDKIGEGHDK